jgi:hypothetical protein
MNKVLMGLVIAVMSATVGQVWLVQTPLMSSVYAEQKKDQEDIKYIRDKIDKLDDKTDRIYQEVRKK